MDKVIIFSISLQEAARCAHENELVDDEWVHSSSPDRLIKRRRATIWLTGRWYMLSGDSMIDLLMKHDCVVMAGDLSTRLSSQYQNLRQEKK